MGVGGERLDARESSSSNREETPRVADALEPMLAAILEAESGAGDEILHGAGDEHLVERRLQLFALGAFSSLVDEVGADCSR